MKRTNPIWQFVVQNRRMLLFLLLPLIGCIGGILLYPTIQPEWAALLPIKPITGGVAGAFAGWWTACFQPLCLMAVLFVCGLSALGAPIVVAVPVFWGIGLGLCEAHYAALGASGWLVLAFVLLPSAVMELVALLMAASEALRMSLLVAVQLLPRSPRCGGLFEDFRLYGVRFLLLLALVLGAGALDVIVRLVLHRVL